MYFGVKSVSTGVRGLGFRGFIVSELALRVRSFWLGPGTSFSLCVILSCASNMTKCGLSKGSLHKITKRMSWFCSVRSVRCHQVSDGGVSFSKLSEEFQQAEMLRMPLEEIVLQAKV